MNIGGVDILHSQIVKITLLGATNLNNRKGLKRLAVPKYPNGNLGAYEALFDKDLVAVFKRLLNGTRKLRRIFNKRDAVARSIYRRLH